MKINKRKWNSEEVVDHMQKIRKIIEAEKKASKAENFTSVSDEELEIKFLRVNSPMIIWQSWNHTNQGGQVNYRMGIYNPDPTQSIWTFAHVWVGSGHVDPVVGTFLGNIDTRFPQLTEPGFPGLNIAPGNTGVLDFALQVPSSVDETNYLGNSCLMRANWHDVGQYYDRGLFVFKVS